MTLTHRTERFPWLRRSLRIFADVRPGETSTGMILLSNIFLILTSYYLIKAVREGWLAVSAIRSLSKIEVKAYTNFAQSALLLGVVPIYAWMATRWTRRALIARISLFFLFCLTGFWLLQPDWLPHGVPYVGVAFYIWVGIFSVTIVAQFWSFAADMYNDERGKRLFPLIAIGGAAGSVVGSWLAARFVDHGMEAFNLLLVAAVPLSAAMVLSWWADRRDPAGLGRKPQASEEPAATDSRGPFELIVRHRYLLAVAIFGLLVNWVNSNGENILYGLIQQSLEADAVTAGITDPAELSRFIKTSTTEFYGNLYFWVNLVSLVLQAFVVSRLLKYGGFTLLIFLTPLVALMSYSLMTLFPLLMVIKVMKIAENSTNYSVNNTARHVLWLPAPRALIYKAKTTVDTLFVRIGDGLAAVTVFVGVQFLQLPLMYFLVLNVVLVLIWAAVATVIARENRRMVAETARAAPLAEATPQPATAS